MGKRVYLILLDVELAAVIHAFTASPLDDSNTVYLSIKLLLGREGYLIQKVAATQTTMSTSDCLTLPFQRIRLNFSLHSYLQDSLAWAQISKRLSQAPVLDSFTAGSSPVDSFTVNISLICRREHTAVQFASKSLS